MDGTTAVPMARFVAPIVWRRLGLLSKIALKVAHDCLDPQHKVRMVFASRHGELKRTTSILCGMGAVEPEPVSPTAFSLSVLNAMSGISGIARKDRSATCALSAGEETLGYGLLEAFAQYEEDKTSPVLFVYADEPVDAMFHAAEDETAGRALALLIGGTGGETMGRLVCATQECADEGRLANGNETDETRAEKADMKPHHVFASQHAAVLTCLTTHSPAAWRARRIEAQTQTGAQAGVIWQWSWHDGAA